MVGVPRRAATAQQFLLHLLRNKSRRARRSAIMALDVSSPWTDAPTASFSSRSGMIHPATPYRPPRPSLPTASTRQRRSLTRTPLTVRVGKNQNRRRGRREGIRKLGLVTSVALFTGVTGVEAVRGETPPGYSVAAESALPYLIAVGER